MVDTSRPPGFTSALPCLKPELDASVGISAAEALYGLARVISSTLPMFEIHRDAPPPIEPRTVDEALELLRASALVEQVLRRELAMLQEGWAMDAVLRGAPAKAAAQALGISGGAVTKRWPRLGKIRQGHLWFRQPDNATAWASACSAVQRVTATMHADCSINDEDLDHIAQLADNFLSASEGAESRKIILLPEWHDLVLYTPSTVDVVVNPTLVTASTTSARTVLNRLRQAWRAYRAGITVDDQIERDKARAREG